MIAPAQIQSPNGSAGLLVYLAGIRCDITVCYNESWTVLISIPSPSSHTGGEIPDAPKRLLVGEVLVSRSAFRYQVS